MNLAKIKQELDLSIKTAEKNLCRNVSGCYAGDMLSDVIANAENGNLWITIQIHINIVAVAVLKDLSGILLTNDREPDYETLNKAESEGIPIFTTSLSAYEVSGRLYNLGIRGRN